MFSIIIPSLNEENILSKNTLFFKKIKDKLSAEIIVVDGGSDDATIHVEKNFSCKVTTSFY